MQFATPEQPLQRRLLALLDDGLKDEEVTAAALAGRLSAPVPEIEAELRALARFGNLTRRTGRHGEARYSAAPRRKLLGDMLVKAGYMSREQLEDALAERARTGDRLGAILLERGYVSKSVLGKMLERQRGVPYVSLSALPIDETLVRSVPERIITEHTVVPIARVDGEIHLAMLDPTDIMAIDIVEKYLRARVRPFLTTEADFSWALTKFFDVTRKADEDLRQAAVQAEEREPAERPALAVADTHDASPAVRVINTIIRDAVRTGATDIHIEPELEQTRVRVRVEGLLLDKSVLPRPVAEAVTSRLKVLAGMDIAERVRPQDGRIVIRLGGREYDLRIATVGTAFGERLALRVLSNRQVLAGVERLGLFPGQQDTLQTLLRRQHGMILVTGPTGSGKTTTLYAAISHINDRVRNIMTIEDPIEYRLSGITQIPVREKSGITFGVGLRALLRQDPDVVMVGEIRDPETASIAVHAALTGHLVLTSLHTNNAAGALVRLLAMGVEPYLLASSVLAVVGQRLVRVLCTACKREYEARDVDRRLLGLPPDAALRLFAAAGCAECGNLCYKGRTGAFEIIVMSDGVRDLVLQRRPAGAVMEAAIAEGMRPLRSAIIRNVLDGVTSIEELQRLTTVEGD